MFAVTDGGCFFRGGEKVVAADGGCFFAGDGSLFARETGAVAVEDGSFLFGDKRPAVTDGECFLVLVGATDVFVVEGRVTSFLYTPGSLPFRRESPSSSSSSSSSEEVSKRASKFSPLSAIIDDSALLEQY